MSGISASRRFTAVLAALLLLLAAPLGAPAYADPSRVSVTPPDIVYEVFDATGDGQEPVDTQTAPGGFGEVVSFDLADGHYKIRATADGYQESWYTSSSGRYSDSFRELLGYQERKTFETADAIVVDSVTGTSS